MPRPARSASRSSSPITLLGSSAVRGAEPSGRLYISTKPTAAAPQGTVRYMDPAAPAPDERFILDFATPARIRTRGSSPTSTARR